MEARSVVERDGRFRTCTATGWEPMDKSGQNVEDWLHVARYLER